MKKSIYIILFLLLSLLMQSAENEITVFFTNDTNGHPLSFNNGEGGLAARSALIKSIIREKRIPFGTYLILDAGGFLRGRPESNLFNGLPDIAGMNSIGYFASGVGASELYDGVKHLMTINDKAKFYLISSNISAINKKDIEITDRYAIKKIAGLKIGIFSVITQDVLKEIPESSRKDLAISNPIDTARQIVKELRSEKNKVDIVIALTQLGYYPEDSTVGSRYLAHTVEGIDLIIDGRTGIKLDSPVKLNEATIVQAGKWGLYLGEVNIQTSDSKIIGINYTLHPVNVKDENNNLIGKKVPEDFGINISVKNKMPGLENLLNKQIGKLEAGVKLDTKDANKKEIELGNLICDAMLDYTKADIAIQNAGGISESALEGSITRKSFDNIIKYDNSLFICGIKGSDIIRIFEYSLSSAGTGSFLQTAGVRLNYSKSFNKITKIEINGKPVENNKFYNVAINSWLADGNDGYDLFRENPYKINLNILHREVIYSYIEENKNFKAVIDGRINIVE